VWVRGSAERIKPLAGGGQLDPGFRPRLDCGHLGLRYRCHDAKSGRIEARHQRLAGGGHFADLDVPRRHHAAVWRDDGRKAAFCCRGSRAGDQRADPRLCRLVGGFGLIQRGLADELLREQLPRALVLRARIGQRGPRFLDLRLACLDSLARSARVDAHDHLPLLHVVPDVEPHVDDSARHLGRHG
jgi:hypothetical protein